MLGSYTRVPGPNPRHCRNAVRRSGGSRLAGPRGANHDVTSPQLRPGRQAAAVPTSHPPQVPHAALLIDFDNVTLGIRSDLTKELKTLLNSDIIRGKVAVQRAYADWRRYPQYIVPLSERSIDLIFATAVGSTKKNATDIRLAIDAIELVFTRPEIGTFILLSGDSDFSALVIKLKEYGKYVIGVGIRESASDLLIQNCDEYYSYSELAGLTKEVDAPSAQRDAWELVREAVVQMQKQGDVMRSDRLKQVMQQIDPNFDERNAGFNRFSKFVAEAGNRGLVRLTKLDNGQYEVAPVDGAGPPPPAAAKLDRGRERERDRARETENGRARGRSRRGRGREGRRAEEPARAPRVTEPEAAAAPQARGQLTLGAAFTLLTNALAELGRPVDAEALRARMAALHGREDPLLEPARFGRFLRQANDAEVADVRKLDDDHYEVVLTRVGRARVGAAGRTTQEAEAEAIAGGLVSADVAAPAPTPPTAPPKPAPPPTAGAPARAGAALRFRRGSRGGPARPQEVPMVGVVAVEPESRTDSRAEPKQKRTRKPAAAGGGRSRARAGAPDGSPPAEVTEDAARPTRRGTGRARGRSKTA